MKRLLAVVALLVLLVGIQPQQATALVARSCVAYTLAGPAGTISMQQTPEGSLAWGVRLHSRYTFLPGVWTARVTVTNPPKKKGKKASTVVRDTKHGVTSRTLHSVIPAQFLKPGGIVVVSFVYSFVRAGSSYTVKGTGVCKIA